MVTRLLAVLGVACLLAFCVAWWPGALLVAGCGLLLLTAIRTDNEHKRKGTRR